MAMNESNLQSELLWSWSMLNSYVAIYLWAVRDRNTSTSALAEHVCNTDHPVNWGQTLIIESCRQHF